MFDLRKIPMFRVLVPFVGGVLSSPSLSSDNQISVLIILSFSLWFAKVALYYWQGRRPSRIPWINAPLIFLIIFSTGVGSGRLSKAHDPELPVDKLVVVRGETIGSPSVNSFAYSFDLKLQGLFLDGNIYQSATVLKVYLSMPADSLLPAAGETWQFSGKLKSIRNSGNPGSPDYRAIMGRKNCWYRFYVSDEAEKVHFNRELKGQKRRLSPARIRKNVSDHWHGDLEEVSLLKAVCLGDRSLLTDDMRQSYSAAGGMHLLAVSGLHVGLIWWVLQYMTGWLGLIFRKGKQQALLVVVILWFFAFLTGFSSSVCRAVTMFSFFSVSRMMGERLHPINVILSSAFLLVLIDPQRLMDVGFQLSYAAIIGIVSLHPLSMKLFRIKNPMLRWVWEATSISLAAQLSTTPLVIYYFHQLPLYSLFTSLIAIPMLSLLIAIFVCSVPFVSAGILEEVFNFLLVKLAGLLNHTIEHLGSLPGAVLADLYLNRTAMLVWLLVLLLFILALQNRKKLPCYLLLLMVSYSLTWNSCSRLKLRSSNELIISNFKGASMIIIREGLRVDQYCSYRDSASLAYMKTYSETCWSRRVYKKELYTMGDDIQIKGKVSSCLQVTSGAWIFVSSLDDPGTEPDLILLSGEPELNTLHLSRLVGEVKLVLDGSNRRWYKERMMAEWDRIYLTEASGAYVKRW